MRKSIRVIGAAILSSLLIPSLALAATTHHYTCTDTFGDNTASCADNIFTINDGYVYDNASSGNYPVTNGETYYITAHLTGTGCANWGLANSGGQMTIMGCQEAGDLVDSPIVASGDGTGADFEGRGAETGLTSFNGTISDWCISDTPGECSIGGSATSTASTSPYMTRDEQTFTYAIIIFCLFFPVWDILFRPIRRMYDNKNSV